MQLTSLIFFFQAEDGIRDYKVTGVQTCALPILNFGARDLRGDDLASPGGKPGTESVRILHNLSEAGNSLTAGCGQGHSQPGVKQVRSEERRVGKECRWRGGAES